MSNLKKISSRMKAVKSVQKMARVMQMISVTKFAKMKELVKPTERNASFFRNSLSMLLSNSSRFNSKMTEYMRTCDSTLVVVIGSDRGLCGSFNNALIKFAEEYISTLNSKENASNIKMLFVGRKISSKLSKKFASSMVAELSEFCLPPNFEITEKIVGTLLDDNGFREVHVLYNKFIHIAVQKPIAEVFLPSSFQEEHLTAELNVEMCSVECVRSLLRSYLIAEIYSCIASSEAAENAARMIAMDSANKNSRELMGKLELMYNRARQDSITTGIIEIVSAAESS